MEDSIKEEEAKEEKKDLGQENFIIEEYTIDLGCFLVFLRLNIND